MLKSVFKPKEESEIIDSLFKTPEYINFKFLSDYYDKYGEEKFKLILKYVCSLPPYYNIENLISRVRRSIRIGPYNDKKTVNNILHILKLNDINLEKLTIHKKNKSSIYILKVK